MAEYATELAILLQTVRALCTTGIAVASDQREGSDAFFFLGILLMMSTTSFNPFESKLRLFGEALQTVETSSAPIRTISSIALPKLFTILKNEMLPATIGIDTLRGLSSFMADGMRIGENSMRTGADMLGEIAGGLPASAAGVSLGEGLGAAIGTLASGPLGAIPGSAIGGFIGSVTGSVVGSCAGGKLGEYLVDHLGAFSQTTPSYLAARSPK